MFKCLLILVYSLIIFNINAQEDSLGNVVNIKNIELKDGLGRPYQLELFIQNPLKVVVFFSESCPICQKYTKTLNELLEKYNQKVFILTVFPESTHPKIIKKFIKKYNYKPKIVFDPTQQFAKALNATTTPEAFLLNNQQSILYRGAIDNWYFSLGKKRSEITQHYLRVAIASYLKNEKILIEETIPIGCLIQKRTNP
jgi:thiol-disulfide isomerase/thioredoxin